MFTSDRDKALTKEDSLEMNRAIPITLTIATKLLLLLVSLDGRTARLSDHGECWASTRPSSNDMPAKAR